MFGGDVGGFSKRGRTTGGNEPNQRVISKCNELEDKESLPPSTGTQSLFLAHNTLSQQKARDFQNPAHLKESKSPQSLKPKWEKGNSLIGFTSHRILCQNVASSPTMNTGCASLLRPPTGRGIYQTSLNGHLATLLLGTQGKEEEEEEAAEAAPQGSAPPYTRGWDRQPAHVFSQKKKKTNLVKKGSKDTSTKP